MKHGAKMLVAGVAVLASARASYKVVPMGSTAYEVQLPQKSCTWCGGDDKAAKIATSFCAEQREDAGVVPITPMNWSSSEPGPFIFECLPRG